MATRTGLRFGGPGAVTTRPSDPGQTVAGDTWCQDGTGYPIDAGWANLIRAVLEAAVTDLGGDLGDGDDMLANALTAALADKATVAALNSLAAGLGDSAALDVATSAQYLNNTADLVLTTDQVWAAAAPVTLTDGATITPDFSTGINYTLTLGGNRTVGNPTNVKAGQSGLILVKQDATGSRTLAWDSNWKWPSGTAPTLSTAAGAVDKIFFFAESATIVHVTFEADSR